jgi:hypothetical protein
MLVQNYHVGVTLTRVQESDESTVQSVRLVRAHHGRAA